MYILCTVLIQPFQPEIMFIFKVPLGRKHNFINTASHSASRVCIKSEGASNTENMIRSLLQFGPSSSFCPFKGQNRQDDLKLVSSTHSSIKGEFGTKHSANPLSAVIAVK